MVFEKIGFLEYKIKTLEQICEVVHIQLSYMLEPCKFTKTILTTDSYGNFTVIFKKF